MSDEGSQETLVDSDPSIPILENISDGFVTVVGVACVALRAAYNPTPV